MKRAILGVLIVFSVTFAVVSIAEGTESDPPKEVKAETVAQVTPDYSQGWEEAQRAHAEQAYVEWKLWEDHIRTINYAVAVEEARQQAAAEAAERARRAAAAQRLATAPATTGYSNTAKPTPSGDVWWALAGCETGYKYNNPNTGNGYYGYFQFSLGTWQGVGGPGYPHHHSYEVQKTYAQKLQARSGWGQWPYCSGVLRSKGYI